LINRATFLKVASSVVSVFLLCSFALGSVRAIGDEDLIADTLKNGTVDQKLAVVRSLGEMNSKLALNLLIQSLKDSNSKVGAAAAGILGRKSDPEAVEALRGVLVERQRGVWQTAWYILARSGDKHAEQWAIKALSDKDPAVREFSAKALDSKYQDL
jgi:HEAT repeat protein